MEYLGIMLGALVSCWWIMPKLTAEHVAKSVHAFNKKMQQLQEKGA